MSLSSSIKIATCLAVVGVLCGGLGRTAEAAPGPPSLVKEMRGQAVAVVPPRTVNIRGEAMASVQHRPLEGFDAASYPALFGEVAAVILAKAPLGWEVTVLDPGEAFYDAAETDDPDNDPATTLAPLPSGIPEAAYVAVFRYAELAYDIVEQPNYTISGQLEVKRTVQLTLDLQLVIYDDDGAPLGTFDAETPVSVPEIQPPAQKTKAFYRATAGNLRRMARTVKKEG